MVIGVYPDSRPVVNYDVLPAPGTEHLVMLTSREIAVLRMLAYPYLRRADVTLHPITHNHYAPLSDAEQSTWTDELDQLIDRISGSAPVEIEKAVAAYYGQREIVIEEIIDNDLAAGNVGSYGQPVPAGYAWQLNGAWLKVTSASCTSIGLYVTGPGTDLMMMNVVAPVSGQRYCVNLNLWVPVGQLVFVLVYNATLGDDLQWLYRGWRVPVS